MNRRRFLSLSAALPFVTPAAACARGVGGGSLRDYRSGLQEHLRALAARAFAIRRRAQDELTTADAVRRRQAWVRETLWCLAGGMSERTPLSVLTMGVLDRPGYRLEKLVYESRPGLHVTANLYVPAGRGGPLPGVLFQAGHLAPGKGAAPYQRACQALARLGHVVLVFDPSGQGERAFAPGVSPEDEHDRTGAQLLLAGDTQAGLMLRDAVRSLDVLASRPEVDPARLSAVGQSGGGTLAMLLAAVDDRLAAVAISCADTEDVVSAGFEPPGAVDDAEQDLPGAGPLGFDRWDLLLPLAPRPLLVLVSSTDPTAVYSPAYLANGREQVERLRRAYTLLGAPEGVRWVESAEPHGLSQGRRVEIERFLGSVLQGAEPASGEPETTPEPEDATWVVPGGDVLRALGGRTPVDLARERLPARAAPFSPSPPALASLLGLVLPRPGQAAAVLASTREGGCEVDEIEVEAAPCVWIPARLVRPRAPAIPRATVIVLSPRGREEEAAWHAVAREGLAVALADVRGTGALAPRIDPRASGYVRDRAPEHGYAWASLVLGESLLAQRVADVLALVEGLSLRPFVGAAALVLAARGELTIPALFAAALDPRVRLVYLEGGLVSYRSVLDAADPMVPLASILPGVLTATDLPEVVAGIAPRRVILAGPVDGAGRPVPPSEARALHRSAANVETVPERASWPARLAALPLP